MQKQHRIFALIRASGSARSIDFGNATRKRVSVSTTRQTTLLDADVHSCRCVRLQARRQSVQLLEPKRKFNLKLCLKQTNVTFCNSLILSYLWKHFNVAFLDLAVRREVNLAQTRSGEEESVRCRNHWKQFVLLRLVVKNLRLLSSETQ